MFDVLRPTPPAGTEAAVLRNRARARVAEVLKEPGPRTRRRWSRPWLVLGAAAALAAAAAAVVVPTVLPDGGTPALTTPAWAVEAGSHGTIQVMVRDLRNPAGLEHALRAKGIPAYVRFVTDVVKVKPNSVTEYPACTYEQTGPPLGVSGRLFNQVFSFPPDPPRSAASFIIHPAAVPAGTTVFIVIDSPPAAERAVTGQTTPGANFSLVRTGHLGRCVPN